MYVRVPTVEKLGVVCLHLIDFFLPVPNHITKHSIKIIAILIFEQKFLGPNIFASVST